jgi:hypothetical protein
VRRATSSSWEFKASGIFRLTVFMGITSLLSRYYQGRGNLLNRRGETRVQDAFNPDEAFDADGNAVRHPNYGKILKRQEPRLFRVAMKVSF